MSDSGKVINAIRKRPGFFAVLIVATLYCVGFATMVYFAVYYAQRSPKPAVVQTALAQKTISTGAMILTQAAHAGDATFTGPLVPLREPRWRTFAFRKEPANRCVGIVGRLPGVEKAVSLSRYSIDVCIGEKFTWAEMSPVIEKALREKCGLEP